MCFCKSCKSKIVFVLICTLAEQFNVHKSYKTHEPTLLCIGNLEDTIDLSHIHLAVHRRVGSENDNFCWLSVLYFWLNKGGGDKNALKCTYVIYEWPFSTGSR